MVARARLLQARVLPQRWLDAVRQISLFAAAVWLLRPFWRFASVSPAGPTLGG